MATLLVIFFIPILFIVGYSWPQRSGWFLIIVMPIASGLSATGVVLIPSTTLSLSINRAAFMISLGILLYYRGSLKKLLSTPFVKITILFCLVLFFASLRDSVTEFLFRRIPDVFGPIILGYFLIKTEKDLYRLFKIFALSSGIIGAFAILEYFTLFNPSVTLSILTNPNFNFGNAYAGSSLMARAGSYRVGGLDGFPVFTGIKLAFLMPFAIWLSQKNKIIGIASVLLCLSGLILVQTRAAFIALALGFVFLFFRSSKTFIKSSIPLVIVIIAFILFFPQIINIFDNFWKYSFMLLLNGMESSQRDWSIPLALKYILNRPIFGYGSPAYIFKTLMNGGDLPAPFMYAVSGEILLLGSYLFWISYAPFKFFAISLKKNIREYQKRYLNLIIVALIAGLAPLATQYAERHFYLIFLLIMGVLNVFSDEKNAGNTAIRIKSKILS